jgi:hypothetical protein
VTPEEVVARKNARREANWKAYAEFKAKAVSEWNEWRRENKGCPREVKDARWKMRLESVRGYCHPPSKP